MGSISAPAEGKLVVDEYSNSPPHRSSHRVDPEFYARPSAQIGTREGRIRKAPPERGGPYTAYRGNIFGNRFVTSKYFPPELISALLAFALAWILFEVTARRSDRRSRRELRRALVAELENGEALASTIVLKYARFYKSPKDITFCANEFRWFQKVGRERMKSVGLLADSPDTPSIVDDMSDEDIVTFLSPTHETIGSKLTMPVLDRALAGQTYGFTADQIRALGMVRWQASLLAQDADSMLEMLRLSFTVTDETNHPRVIQNHDERSAAYARRSIVLLNAMRSALKRIRN